MAAGEEELTVLMVGDGEPLAPALSEAMERHGLIVEVVTSPSSTQAAIAVAPDLILLVGDATLSGGTDILGRLSASSLASVIPVVLLADDETLADRLRAFRFGATAVVARTASADAIARRVAELAKEIPERSAHTTGELGESTLDEFAKMLAKELRAGILSIRGKNDGDDTMVRIVLGEGQKLAEVVEGFVSQVRPLVRSAEVVRYEFHEHPSGTVSLLGPDLEDLGGPAHGIHGMRIVVADDDVARADAVAQELRDRGAQVLMTDLAGTRLDRGRAFDPAVLVIDRKALEGHGYQLVRRMREDIRLRWAYLLVVEWDEIWGANERGPIVDSLVERLARLVAPERELRERARSGEPFDTRLEAIGPARLLRALGECEPRARVTVHGRRGIVRIDLADGLVAGAICDLKEGAAPHLEGPLALSAFLAMASGRARIEPARQPLSASLMTTIDVALNQAAGEQMPFRPSDQPPSGSQAPADEARLVGSARLTPPKGAAARHKSTIQGMGIPGAATGGTKPGIGLPGSKKPTAAFVPPPPRPAGQATVRRGDPVLGAKPAPLASKPEPPVVASKPDPAVERDTPLGTPTLSERKSSPPRPPSSPPDKPLAIVSSEPPTKKRKREATLLGMPIPSVAPEGRDGKTGEPRLPRRGMFDPPSDAVTDQVRLPPEMPVERTGEVALPDVPTRVVRADVDVEDTEADEPDEFADEPTTVAPAPVPEPEPAPIQATPPSATTTDPKRKLGSASEQRGKLAMAKTMPMVPVVRPPGPTPAPARAAPKPAPAEPRPPEPKPARGFEPPLPREEPAPAAPPAAAAPPLPAPGPPRLPESGLGGRTMAGPAFAPSPPAPPAAPAAAAPAPAVAAASPERANDDDAISFETADPFTATPMSPEPTALVGRPTRRRTGLWLGLVAATALIVGGAIGTWVILSKRQDEVATNLPAPPPAGTGSGPQTAEAPAEPEGEPGTEEPSTAEPSTAEPSTAEPRTAEPTMAEPRTAEPTMAEPRTAEPTMAEPRTAEPTMAEPRIAEPTMAEPPRETAPATQPRTRRRSDPQPTPGVTLPNVPRYVTRMTRSERVTAAMRLRRRALTLEQNRRWAASEAALTEALIYDPNSARIAARLAIAKHRLRKLEEAEAWARRAVTLAPEAAENQVILGDILGAKRDVSGARRAWQEALRINPQNRAARRRLARLGSAG